MAERMAGSEAVLPQVLAALGLMPVSATERRAAAAGLNSDQRLIAEVLKKLDDQGVHQWAAQFPPTSEPGTDPRDYKVEPGLWRSQLLPYSVTIDQAIKDGVWR